MNFRVILLIAILSVGGAIISLEVLVSYDVPDQYERLDTYRDELEKFNQHNQQLLADLEDQITNSNDVHLDRINEEIATIKQVIDENKAELEKVITKLTQIDPAP